MLINYCLKNDYKSLSLFNTKKHESQPWKIKYDER